MTVELKLKEYILAQYGSVLKFSEQASIPYGTIASIFKRGIGNSSVVNIIKICQSLNISADELTAGRIVPKSFIGDKRFAADRSLEDVISFLKVNKSGYLLDGTALNADESAILQNAVEFAVRLIRAGRGKTE